MSVVRVLSLLFLSRVISSWALAVAIWSQVETKTRGMEKGVGEP
jgi:hypothetical protein